MWCSSRCAWVSSVLLVDGLVGVVLLVGGCRSRVCRLVWSMCDVVHNIVHLHAQEEGEGNSTGAVGGAAPVVMAESSNTQPADTQPAMVGHPQATSEVQADTVQQQPMTGGGGEQQQQPATGGGSEQQQPRL